MGPSEITKKAGDSGKLKGKFPKKEKRNFPFTGCPVILYRNSDPTGFEDQNISNAAGKDVPMKLSEARKVLETLQKEIAAEMRYDEQQSLLYGLVGKQRVQALQLVLRVTENLPDQE